MIFDQVEKRRERTETQRFWPDDIRNIDRVESWLSDMAEEGWRLDAVGVHLAYFKGAPPQKIRYRIDVLSRELTADELALYDSCGWHYAAERRERRTAKKSILFYFFETDGNAAAPELHTDPLEQAESLRYLDRAGRFDFWMILTATAAVVGIMAYFSFFFQPYTQFEIWTEGSVLNQIGALYFGMICLTAYRWRAVRRLRRRLAGGEPLDHRADYRAARRRYRLVKTVFWLSIAAYAVLGAAYSFLDDPLYDAALPEGAPDFPAVRLRELRQEDGEAVYGEHGQTGRRWTTAGARLNELLEYGTADGADVRLLTACFRLPSAWTAARAYDALLEDGRYRGIGGRYNYEVGLLVPVDTGLVDEAWIAYPAEDNGWQETLFVRDGRYLVNVSYSEGGLERMLPLLAQRLDAAQGESWGQG